MKKVLLIGFILVILLLAFPQGVMAAPITPPVVVVNAQLPMQTFVFEVNLNPAAPPSGPTWPWILAANSDNLNPKAINLSVQSSRDWDINAWDNTPAVSPRLAGHMFANGHPLLKGFEMQMGGTGGTLGTLTEFSTDATPGQLILRGNPYIGTQTDHSDIRQTTQSADFGSTEYKITLTFTCSEVAVP